MKKKLFAICMTVTLVLAMFAGCGEDKEAAGEPIKIASKPMTEQYILTEMLKLLIEDRLDVEVEITKGIGGGTTNIHPALLEGEFDLYPEYTGTAWASVYKNGTIPKEEDALFAELQEYYDSIGLAWSELYGFNNTYALAVRNSVAEEYGIETCSDLAKVSKELTFGANPDYYERSDGYGALCDFYGFDFKDTVDLDIGLKYAAVDSGEVDVINAFTTDAQLTSSNVTVLKDDKQYFANYYCGTVVRKDTLEAYPELLDTLNLMSGILTDSDMAALNYELEVNERDEADIAEEFLESKGLL